MKIPKEKFIINIENIGNTVSATIPIAFYEILKEGKAIFESSGISNM